MLLTGTIDIEHDGSVSGYALDQPEKVPDYVASLLDRRVAAWQFEPTVHDGRAVAVRSPMSVRMVARPVGEDGFEVRSEEHTSELQSLMRISYAVFCLKKKKTTKIQKLDETRHTRMEEDDAQKTRAMRHEDQ